MELSGSISLRSLDFVSRCYRDRRPWGGCRARGVCGRLHHDAHFEARASLRTWLYRIARNRCAHVSRDETRHRGSLANTTSPSCTGHTGAELSPEQQLQHQEELAQVQASLTQLREADRTILILTYMRELTTAQIAEILMITPQQVRRGAAGLSSVSGW